MCRLCAGRATGTVVRASSQGVICRLRPGDHGTQVAPTVFDRTSATASAALIGAFGGATLVLRYYIDYFMD